MKMGTVLSPWHYDAAAAQAIRPDNLGRTAILRYASWAGPDCADGPVTLRLRPFRSILGRRYGPGADVSVDGFLAWTLVA